MSLEDDLEHRRVGMVIPPDSTAVRRKGSVGQPFTTPGWRPRSLGSILVESATLGEPTRAEPCWSSTTRMSTSPAPCRSPPGRAPGADPQGYGHRGGPNSHGRRHSQSRALPDHPPLEPPANPPALKGRGDI